MMTRLMIPMSATLGFMVMMNSGIFASSSKGSPADPKPIVTGNCLAMMITPIEASNP